MNTAITELEIAIKLPKAPPETRGLLERAYSQSGRKEALRSFYAQTLDKFPDNVFWHNRAAAFALAESRYADAERLYTVAWQKRKDDNELGAATAIDGYLKTLILGGKSNKVLEEGRKHIDRAFAPGVFIRMAEAKLKLGDRNGAIQYCRTAVDKAGTNINYASSILDKMYRLLGVEEVRDYCSERLQADPTSLVANFAMFNLAKINREYNKAADYLDKCLQVVGSDNTAAVNFVVLKAQILQLAYNRTSDSNYLKRSIAVYENLLAKMPDNVAVLNNFAYMLAENNERLDEALKYAERVYELRPNEAGFLDTYAYVLYKNGKISRADEFLQAALQQYEQDNITVQAEVYEHQGMIKEELQAIPEALEAYRMALETGSDTLSEKARERIKAAIERLSRKEEI